MRFDASLTIIVLSVDLDKFQTRKCKKNIMYHAQIHKNLIATHKT